MNSGLINQTINARGEELLTSPLPTEPMETLARAQALILYLIMRLFDSDSRTRASAATMVPALESAGFALLNHIDWNLTGIAAQQTELALYPLTSTREFWDTWIFQESARRTFLITFLFLQVYRLLSRQTPLHCDGKLGLCHAWTFSAHLWHARDAFDFAVAWRDKNHFVVTNADFNEVFSDAKGDDVDTFGKIFITALLGIDGAKGWLYTRGASLE